MSSLTTVPKPADAGNAQNAIANTKLAFVNVRTGPGTNYRDIGDLRDNSLVAYYPGSKTDDNWYYMEFRGLSGWVAGSVVEFEPTFGGSTQEVATPYDGKVAIWHWKGSAVAESTIDELAANIKNRAPNVDAVWVKTSDGASWQGDFDTSSMAVNGVADIERWVSVLSRYGLEFHAWCVPLGIPEEVDREIAIISAACKVAGVKSMILDVEPYAQYWRGGREGIRPFMLKLRRAIGGDFHLGMTVDPRPWHYNSIFPDEWYPFIGSIHTQSYWATFRATPEAALQQTYDTWGGYGRPVFPALQGDAELIDQNTAHTLSTQRHGAQGISWWRYGTISQFGAVNLPVEIKDPGEEIEQPTDNFVDEVIVQPKGDNFRSGTYGSKQFSEFEGTWNWLVLYVDTEPTTSEVWVEWAFDLPQSGRYEISTFVPARHATTTRARYKVHGIKGTSTEVVIDINQANNRNRWVSLGIFDIDTNQAKAGRVFMNDVTGESGKVIAFDAVRFRRIVTVQPDTGDNGGTTGGGTGGTDSGTDGGTSGGTDRPTVVDGAPVADGYDSPVGTATERRGTRLWPAGWLDASPFGRLYFVGTPSEAYHTGADLNFGAPRADLGMPTYACANGVVTFAGSIRIWGNVIIIRHDPLYTPSGQVLYSRYAHVQNMTVSVGGRVVRGQQIAEIGDAFGRFIPHLHFDLSPTSLLETRPSDWPGTDQGRLLANYIDPLIWIRNNRP